MSMISSQYDKLRDTAMRVEIFLEGSTDAIPMDTHKQLRDAADTILELREMAQKANAENAELRELVKDMWGAYCFGNGGCGDAWLTDEQDMAVRRKVRELGIEVDG